MNSGSQLFQLIKSLSKADKRYFKMKASHYAGNKVYTKLFDLMDKQAVYNEAAIIKEFENKKIIKNIYRVREYLLTLIVESLEQQYRYENVDSKLMHLALQIDILLKKNQFYFAEKYLETAKKLASKHEKHLAQIELTQLEYRLMAARNFTSADERSLMELHNRNLANIEKYKNLNKYNLLESKASLLIRQADNRNAVNDKKFNAIIAELRLSDRSLVKSNSTMAKSLNIQIMYAFYTFNYSQAIKIMKKMIGLYEKIPDFISENNFNYITIHSNLFIVQIQNGNYGDAKETLIKISGIKSGKPLLQQRIQMNVFRGKLQLYGKTGDYETGIKLSEEIFSRNIDKIFLKYGFGFDLYFFTSILFFEKEQFKKAKEYVLMAIDMADKYGRPGQKSIATIFLLIIYYEMKNDDLIEYYMRSVYRFLLKQKQMHKFERVVLYFIRKNLFGELTPKKLIDEFSKLKISLEEIFKDPFEKYRHDSFDYISWLEGKIENRSFAEVVQKKAKMVVGS